MLAVVLAVILANLPYLLDLVDSNPLASRSGLVSAVTPGLTGGSSNIDPNNGFISQALSHRAMLDVVHLRMPWWNPYEGTGAPLAGEMQSAALFPVTMLTLLSNGQLYEHILLELLAGLSTYALVRRLAVNRWASAAAGIAFALNGTFSWLEHATVNPVAFLPLLLLGIEFAYSAAVDGRRGGWWLVAVAGALSFYAGFPEVAYIDALLGVCWFVWRCACLPRHRVTAFAGKAASGAIVGTLLSAPLLIATVGYLGHADVGLHGTSAIGNARFTSHQLPQLVLPYIYGPIFGFNDPKSALSGIWGAVGGYLSTSLLLFGLLGVFSRGRRGLRVMLGIWILLAFSRTYGQPPLLDHVIGVLPGMSRVAFFRYAPASLELAVVILAALGLDDLARTSGRSRRLLWAAFGSLVVVAIAGLGARSLADKLGSAFSHRPYFVVAIVWGAGIVVAGGAVAFVRRPRVRTALLAALLAVDSLALFLAPELAAPRAVQLDLAPVAFLQRHLGTQRFFTLGTLAPNYGSYFGIAELNTNDLPVPTLFQHYVHSRLDPVVDPALFVGNYGGGRSFFAPSPAQELQRNLAGYREAGVAYILTPAGQALPQSAATFQLVYRSPSTWIYHLAGAARYFTATNRGCTLTTGSREAVQVSCATPTELIRRETDLPGWSAQVDGHSVPVHRTDALFQTIRVKAGRHRVTFSYLPPKLLWGLLAFAAGCGWLLLPAVAIRRHRRGAVDHENLRS